LGLTSAQALLYPCIAMFLLGSGLCGAATVGLLPDTPGAFADALFGVVDALPHCMSGGARRWRGRRECVLLAVFME
jgi:hypothetical protein